MRDKIYYIADTFGSYYGFNQSNKLVPVNGKEQATKLTFLKANNVLQEHDQTNKSVPVHSY